MLKQKTFVVTVITFIMISAALGCLAGCFTTDTYHDKKQRDTMQKDIDTTHKDIDRALGLDVPSPLVEEK